MATTQVYTHVLAEDLAEAVDAMPDVEAQGSEAEHRPDAEALQLAEALASASPETRAALAALLGTVERTRSQ